MKKLIIVFFSISMLSACVNDGAENNMNTQVKNNSTSSYSQNIPSSQETPTYANGEEKSLGTNPQAPALDYANMMGASAGELEYSMAEAFNNFSFQSYKVTGTKKDPKTGRVKNLYDKTQRLTFYEKARGDLEDCMKKRGPYVNMVSLAGIRNNVDPILIHAIIMQESCYNPNAGSPMGAYGLMQMLKTTAKQFGVLPHELLIPEKNVEGGTKYLAHLLKYFAKYPTNQVAFAIASYNAGPGGDHYKDGRVPAYRETQKYVQNVAAGYNRQRMMKQRNNTQVEARKRRQHTE